MVDPGRAQRFVYESCSLVLCVLPSLEESSPLVILSATQSLAQLEQSLFQSKNNYYYYLKCNVYEFFTFFFCQSSS